MMRFITPPCWEGASCSRQVGILPLGMATTARRLWFRVDVRGPDDCWEWLGSRSPVTRRTGGYGKISVGGKMAYVHRVVYELTHGRIPDGLTIDHLCRNRACANPAHLEAVASRTNILRGDGACARHARKTHCSRGHEYTPENTYLWRGQRQCRICIRRANLRWYHANRGR